MNRLVEQCGEDEGDDFGRALAEIRQRVDQQSRGQVISSLFEDVERDGDASAPPGG